MSLEHDERVMLAMLRCAWHWVKSNPEANFKAHCRERYSIFELGKEPLLRQLAGQLLAGEYEPEAPEKILVRKPAGMLRPITVLTVRDQIVYQALAIPVAEKLYARVANRYRKTTFGHLYNGSWTTGERFFFSDWRDGYREYNRAAGNAHYAGFKHLVTFDLTACYDSIDHTLLLDEIRGLGVEPWVPQLLERCLKTWTEVKPRDGRRRVRRHGHGIPQGPLPSGLMSEVVLQHFDAEFFRNRRGWRDVRFFRYVDDIRIFGRSFAAIESALIRLDQLCKELGLFPQKSKIESAQRPLTAPELRQRLKSISNPAEAVVQGKPVDQRRLRDRILPDLVLGPAAVSNSDNTSPTRLKFLLAHAERDTELVTELIDFLCQEGGMAYLANVCRYLIRHSKMTPAQMETLIVALLPHRDYDSVQATLFEVLSAQAVDPNVRRAALRFAPKGVTRWQADMAVAFLRWAGAWGCSLGSFRSFFWGKLSKSWLARARVLDDMHGRELCADPGEVISYALGEVSDLQLSAVWWCVASGRQDLLSRMQLSPIVQAWRSTDVIAAEPTDVAHVALNRLVRLVPRVDWPAMLGEDYPAFTLALLRVVACWETEPSRAMEHLRIACTHLSTSHCLIDLKLDGRVKDLLAFIPRRRMDGMLELEPPLSPRSAHLVKAVIQQELGAIIEAIRSANPNLSREAAHT